MIDRITIKKVHAVFSNIKTGQEALNCLRREEPIFMEEVEHFISIILDKCKKEIDEEVFLLMRRAIESASILGFVVGQEQYLDMFLEESEDAQDEYIPTEEEWEEIEKAILEEEEEERREAEEEDARELSALKTWMKDNGMSWDKEYIKEDHNG